MLKLTSLVKELGKIEDPAARNAEMQRWSRRNLAKTAKKEINKLGIRPDQIELDPKLPPEVIYFFASELKQSQVTPTSTRVYNYGCACSHNAGWTKELEKSMMDEIYLSNRYRNKFVEIERKRREKCNALIREKNPLLLELEAKLNDANKVLEEFESELKKRNAKNKSKSHCKEIREPMQKLRQKRKETNEAFKAEKKKTYEDASVQKALHEIDDWAEAEGKNNYGDETLDISWGTRVAIKGEMSRIRSGPPPRFKRFDGNGKISIQLQNGGSLDDIFSGKDSRLTIQRINERLHVAYMCIGRNRRKIAVPFILHRPFPENVVVKWCFIVCNRIATHSKWEIQFVLEGAVGTFDKPKSNGNGYWAMDVGWRLLGSGDLRVASWAASDGSAGELILPAKLLSRFRKSDDLKSIRDKNFNEAMPKLIAWLESNPIPQWMKDQTETIHKWEAQRRLARLILEWRNKRFPGDDSIFDVMNAWRKQDRHLYDWQENNQKKAIRQRRHIYDNFRKVMAAKYPAGVGVEDINWAELQKTKPVENQTEADKAITKNRRMAAVGELVSGLEQHTKVVRLDAKGTTYIHNKCGHPSGQYNSPDLIHLCQHCGETFDRDNNAAKNLLKAMSESLGVEK